LLRIWCCTSSAISLFKVAFAARCGIHQHAERLTAAAPAVCRDYIAASFLPEKEGIYDYISVDGRARVHCLKRALPLLKPEGGILMLVRPLTKCQGLSGVKAALKCRVKSGGDQTVVTKAHGAWRPARYTVTDWH